ncbi:hypothetical protein COV19_00440 [Candidatus Woesearchaeota archaeon CG10_big_fil_rev_8_21_14_0_10_44_13]|nr:MAG: hypothetical protein COV19_00440 [Candidatus Woesearchaeota archaeon CG10_big_fil_rev_8_21_14_0_10_44_13]
MAQFIEKARKIIKENKGLFETLEEFDRTGKLRKANYKGRYNFTIDEELMNKLRSYCLKNDMKMSAVVEGLIKDFLKKR